MSEALLSEQLHPSIPLIPVTLLTGFLGAGKTTLLNHLLKHPGNEKFAVIVNEFGQVGIDGELIVRSDETMIELTNGCVCCTVRTDLVETLTDLLEKKYGVNGKSQETFTRIIIETTGLADPVPLIQTFSLDDSLKKFFILEQVITLVDAKNFEKERRYLPLAEEQVAFADRVILNKQDLVSTEELQVLKHELMTINPLAPITVTTQGQLEVKNLFEKTYQETLTRFLAKQESKSHNHLSDIGAMSVSTKVTLREDYFKRWIDELIAHCGPDIFRYKGIVSTTTWPTRQGLLQGVHTLYSLMPGRPWQETDVRETKVVIIGRTLDTKWIQQTFEQMVQDGEAICT